MRALGVVVLALCAAAAQPAAAQPAAAQPSTTVAKPSPPRRTQSVSTGVYALQGLAGLQGQYERQFRPRWSWIAGGGLRFNARGDYGSSTLAAGGEARFWLRGKALWSRAPQRSIIGWYVGGRLDLAWTRTVDEVDDRTIGNDLSVAITGTLGYRLLVRNRVEMTSMFGLGVTEEVDLRGRLPAYARPTIRFGFTVGYMF